MAGACRCVFRIDHVAQPVSIAQPECVPQSIEFCVSIAESQHLAVQWSLYPGGAINPAFIEQLGQCAGQDDLLLFLSRSGVRSRYAAKLATENGFVNCYDILEGFEGDRDEDGHRKSIGGWCHVGLPWVGA